MNNRFVFIIPFRNVAPFIKECANSLINQNNKNWIAHFIDDVSTDNTISNIPTDPRFIIKRNTERLTALPNIHYGIMDLNLNDDDVICILDGDDFLIRPDALDIVGKFYDDGALLTYGQYVASVGNIGHCRPYTKESFNHVRDGREYWASHLRTFKYKLYKEVMVQDPNLECYKDKNGEWYRSCYDVAVMVPLLEIAGFDKVRFNVTPIYFYRIHPQNDYSVDPVLQYAIADEVYSKKKFTQVF